MIVNTFSSVCDSFSTSTTAAAAALVSSSPNAYTYSIYRCTYAYIQRIFNIGRVLEYLQQQQYLLVLSTRGWPCSQCQLSLKQRVIFCRVSVVVLDECSGKQRFFYNSSSGSDGFLHQIPSKSIQQLSTLGMTIKHISVLAMQGERSRVIRILPIGTLKVNVKQISWLRHAIAVMKEFSLNHRRQPQIGSRGKVDYKLLLLWTSNLSEVPP